MAIDLVVEGFTAGAIADAGRRRESELSGFVDLATCLHLHQSHNNTPEAA
jgi:hypothetical protein